MKEKFLIGELAKLFNVSSDTLRHYDRIDLLKSAHDDHNRYRYYGIRSFFKLSRILFFKSLDISLKDIKEYMRNKSTNNLLTLLKKKEAEIDIKMNKLTNLKKKIQTKLELLESINKDLSMVKLKKIPKRFGIFLDMSDVENDFDRKEVFKKSEKYLEISSLLIEGQIFTSLSKENLEKRIFNKFRYFIEIVSIDSERCNQLKEIPENEYACITFFGPYRDMEKHYRLLIQWIEENGYQIAGDSIKKNIVDYDFSDSENEYVSEIQIPIRNKI